MEEIKYLSTHPQLPASAPVGCPHIIDVESVDQESPSSQPGLGIPDMVVTVLFNHDPKTLARFLDLSHDFKFQAHYRQEERRPDFCIIRKNTTVTCGYLNESTLRHIQPWDIEYVYRMDDGPAGKWEPVIWRAWPGPQEIKGQDVLEIGGIFAKNYLPFQVWEGHDSLEMLVEDSCSV